MKPEIIYPPKQRTMTLFLSSLLLTGGSFWLIGPDKLILWFPFGFFGCCCLVFAANLLPSASFLKIEADRFTVVSFFVASQYSWKEVVNFRAEEQGVVFEIVPDDADQSVFAVRERNLPLPLGFRTDETARLLNEFLKQRKKEPNQAPEPTAPSGRGSS